MALLHSEWLDLRRRHIGSSEVASLFGLDERRTLFELWHQKAGNLPEPELEDERVFWGTVLGPAIGQGIAEREGWTIRKVRRYIEHPHVAGMGASLDYEIFGHPRGAGTLEIKNVDRLVARDWPDGLPPFRFERLPGAAPARLPAEPRLGRARRADRRQLAQALRVRAPSGRHRQDRARRRGVLEVDRREPAPRAGLRPRPAGARGALRQRRAGSVRDLRGHQRLERLCAEYERAREDETAAERRKRAAKGAILSIIEDTETVFCEGFKVLAPERAGGEVSYQRGPYRDFRLYSRSAGEEDQAS